MNGAHSREAGVECHEHVKALGFADFADNQAIGAHPKRFFDEPPHGNLAGTLQVGLSTLQADDVAQRELQLKNLFYRNHTLSSANRCGEAIEKRRFLHLV